MKQPPVKPFPQGLKVGKPLNQFRLKSALNLEKTNPIPFTKIPPAKARRSAIVGFKPAMPKPHYTEATNFKR